MLAAIYAYYERTLADDTKMGVRSNDVPSIQLDDNWPQLHANLRGKELTPSFSYSSVDKH